MIGSFHAYAYFLLINLSVNQSSISKGEHNISLMTLFALSSLAIIEIHQYHADMSFLLNGCRSVDV